MNRGRLTFAGVALFALLLFVAGAGDLLAKKPVKPPPQPNPPPDSHAIVYVNDWWRGPLYVMDIDGGNNTLILADEDAFEPSYSPSGDEVAYQTNTGGNGLWIVSLDGSGVRKVAARIDRSVWGTSWSAGEVPATDTELIAFTDGNEDYIHDLLVVAPDGTGLTNLTETPTIDECHPSWNRTGELLVALKIGTGIVIYEIGEGPAIESETNITASGPLSEEFLGGIGQCMFAHTSDLVVVQATLAGESHADIWVIDPADPENPVNVTDTADITESGPCWNADDSRIIMTAPGQKIGRSGKPRTGRSCLFSIKPDGTDRTQLGSGYMPQFDSECRR